MTRISVTAFLIRRDATQDVFEFLRSLPESVPLKSPLEGTFHPIPSPKRQPGWAQTIEAELLSHRPSEQLFSQTAAGLIKLRIAKRIVLITFGHAWMRLQTDWYHDDFGRRACLNLIKVDDLKQIRLEQVLAKRHRQVERSPTTSSLGSFNFESDRDLVFSVEGESRHKLISGNVRGGAPIRFDVPIERLGKALHLLCKKQGLGYQRKFPDIDNLIAVTNKKVIDDLELALEADMRAANPTLTMGPPISLETIDQDLFFTYEKWNKKNHAKAWTLNYAAWLSSLKGAPPTLELAKKPSISVVDSSTSIKRTSISPRDCFSFDTSRRDGHFVTFSGKWYIASPNLQKRIADFLATLSAPSQPPPTWNGIDIEKDYNTHCCSSSPNLVHMDARNVMYGGGQSKFEFCDFLDIDKKILYFVKNPSSAAGMSHLYEQVRRTVELFFGSNEDYLNQLRQKFSDAYPAIDPSWLHSPPRSVEWEICMVSMGKPATHLSMFSKCGLMKLHREVSNRCRLVSFAQV